MEEQWTVRPKLKFLDLAKESNAVGKIDKMQTNNTNSDIQR